MSPPAIRRNEDFIMSMTLQHKQENMVFKRKWQKKVSTKKDVMALYSSFGKSCSSGLTQHQTLFSASSEKKIQSTSLIINEQKAETKQFLKRCFSFQETFFLQK